MLSLECWCNFTKKKKKTIINNFLVFAQADSNAPVWEET